MKQNQFVRLNQDRWQTFDQLCDNKAGYPADFSKSYRGICGDLAIARTRHYSPMLIEKLNALVRKGQNQLYQTQGFKFSHAIHNTYSAFAYALYENRLYLWASMLVFWGLALIAFTWVIIDPSAVNLFLDAKTVNSMESMYDNKGNIFIEGRKFSSDFYMFGFYIYNNIGIAFQMFGGGAIFCVGALLPLLFNSFYFGTIAAHIINVGYHEAFFSFVVTHSSFELTAIIIAAAAGCKIGYSFLSPKQFSRGYLVKKAGSSVLPLIIGAFVMLFIAALIEAFWSASKVDAQYKYLLGGFFWMLVLYRFYRGTRYAR